MNRFLSSAVLIVGLCSTSLMAYQVPVESSLPRVVQKGAVKQLMVDGKPFTMLAGELHNSSASNSAYMKPVWDRLEKMHLNTVISTVSWELLEPEEGKYDFSLVDDQVQDAQKHGLHLVLIWFGSWKNGESSYAPLWVKLDHKRFPIQVRRQRAGTGQRPSFGIAQRDTPLSPLGNATMKADAKAYRALMRHLKETDSAHTVLMMQVENEIGLLGDSRDRSALADEAWAKPVPKELIGYLAKNKSKLLPETKELWAANGNKTSGTWSEIFGTSEWAEEAFMAWHYSQFVNYVADQGKAELGIPMYVNAWLGPQPGEVLPGDWPSGGPVSRVMDIWRAAASSIDFYAPDIYAEDYKGTTALYTRSENPLFIPETRDQAGNLFWAIGHHSALGWSVFGVDDLSVEGQLSKSYNTLKNFLPQLMEWQSQGKVDAALLVDGQESESVKLGGYKVTLSKPSRRGPAAAVEALPALQAGGVAAGTRALPADARPFCLVINTQPDEFLLVGSNVAPSFELEDTAGAHAAIAFIDEGSYVNNQWVPGRRLNGDEGRPSLPAMSWSGEAKVLPAIRIRLYRSAN